MPHNKYQALGFSVTEKSFQRISFFFYFHVAMATRVCFIFFPNYFGIAPCKIQPCRVLLKWAVSLAEVERALSRKKSIKPSVAYIPQVIKGRELGKKDNLDEQLSYLH